MAAMFPVCTIFSYCFLFVEIDGSLRNSVESSIILLLILKYLWQLPSLEVIWTTITHFLGVYLNSTCVRYNVFKIVQLTLLQTLENFSGSFLFVGNCTGSGCLWNITQCSKLPSLFAYSFIQVFHSTSGLPYLQLHNCAYNTRCCHNDGKFLTFPKFGYLIMSWSEVLVTFDIYPVLTLDVWYWCLPNFRTSQKMSAQQV